MKLKWSKMAYTPTNHHIGTPFIGTFESMIFPFPKMGCVTSFCSLEGRKTNKFFSELVCLFGANPAASAFQALQERFGEETSKFLERWSFLVYRGGGYLEDHPI